MSKARDAYGLVLTRLRQSFEAGELRPGTALSIRDLAERHRTSTTPVREALVRLSGEGLVHEDRGRGFSSAPLNAAILADLYSLHRAQVQLALDRHRLARSRPQERDTGSARGSPDAHDLTIASSAATLQRLVEASGGVASAQFHRVLLARLAWARRTELALSPEARLEVRDIEAAEAQGDLRRLHAALMAHLSHRTGRIGAVLGARLRDEI